MSNRQAKIALRKSEQEAFLKDREKFNMSRFIQAFELGKQIFEQNKDSLKEDEDALLEKQMEENQKLVDEYLAKEGLDAKSEPEA